MIRAALNAIERAYDLEAAKSDRERFQFLANTDLLTGCVNRRAMLDRLEPELERGRRYRHKVTVLMIDFDWFKKINDTRGHLVGDSVLRKLGDILRQEARTMDIVARYGGEEFTVILPDTDLEGGTILRNDYANGRRSLIFPTLVTRCTPPYRLVSRHPAKMKKYRQTR